MAQQQQRPPSGRPGGGEMHDTIETTAFAGRSAPSPAAGAAGAAGAVVEKLCCHCGKSVSGQKRFTDAEGRYWCYDCGVEDHVRKHPQDGIACAGCGEKFAPSHLVEFDDEVYCKPCEAKVKQARKREIARKAAAAQEAVEQEKRRKMLLIGAGVVAAIGLGAAVWVVAF